MSKLGSALETDLMSLLAYYGETPDSPDSPKPEDFFALILSFSSSLQVRHHLCLYSGLGIGNDDAQKAALDVHDAEEKAQASKPPIITTVEIEGLTSEPVCICLFIGRGDLT
jgi:diaphanous 1